MKVYFKITDIVYEISGDIPSYVGSELQEYLYPEEPKGKHKIYVELKAIDEFSPCSASPIYEGYGYVILKPYLEDSSWLSPEYRIYMSAYDNSPVACYMEKNDLRNAMAGIHVQHSDQDFIQADIVIEYLRSAESVMNMNFMEYLSIDRQLACEKAFILHSCYIEHEGEAIIFTAPSGTGKSTQGSLWADYADARVINGDRAILKLEENHSCRAYGLPFCGSSSINHHSSAHVKAIVFLAQGPDNQIRDTISLDLLRRLMAQTTYSIWTSESTAQVLDIFDHIFKTVPVLEYACTPDRKAVDTLRAYLSQYPRQIS